MSTSRPNLRRMDAHDGRHRGATQGKFGVKEKNEEAVEALITT